MVAGVPVPLPPSASVACREQCCVVLRGGDRGKGVLVVVLVPSGQGSVVIHRHLVGRWASRAAHTSRHSSRSGMGPPGVVRWTPVTAVTSCVCSEVCNPSRASGAWGGERAQALPRRGG